MAAWAGVVDPSVLEEARVIAALNAALELRSTARELPADAHSLIASPKRSVAGFGDDIRRDARIVTGLFVGKAVVRAGTRARRPRPVVSRRARRGVMILHGEAGVGKTALLEYAVEAWRVFRMVRTSGVEADSRSTVEYHLHKAFRKLDVKTRTQLAQRRL